MGDDERIVGERGASGVSVGLRRNIDGCEGPQA